MTEQPLHLGSSVVPLYVERQMKIYAVTDSEYSALSTQNNQTTIFSSVGFSVISIAVSIWVNSLFYQEIPPVAYLAKMFVAPAVFVLSLVFFWLAYQAHRAGNSTWDSISRPLKKSLAIGLAV